jgi:hypothetical protein
MSEPNLKSSIKESDKSIGFIKTISVAERIISINIFNYMYFFI